MNYKEISAEINTIAEASPVALRGFATYEIKKYAAITAPCEHEMRLRRLLIQQPEDWRIRDFKIKRAETRAAIHCDVVTSIGLSAMAGWRGVWSDDIELDNFVAYPGDEIVLEIEYVGGRELGWKFEAKLVCEKTLTTSSYRPIEVPMESDGHVTRALAPTGRRALIDLDGKIWRFSAGSDGVLDRIMPITSMTTIEPWQIPGDRNRVHDYKRWDFDPSRIVSLHVWEGSLDFDIAPDAIPQKNAVGPVLFGIDEATGNVVFELGMTRRVMTNGEKGPPHLMALVAFEAQCSNGPDPVQPWWWDAAQLLAQDLRDPKPCRCARTMDQVEDAERRMPCPQHGTSRWQAELDRIARDRVRESRGG